MLNLREFRGDAHRLADWLPWACLVAPGVILNKDGKVAAAVIGVGGFLGMGEHEVAMSFESLRLSQDSNGKLLVVFNATKDSLKAAPAWTWTGSDRSSTSGTSTAPSNKPMNPSK